MTVARALIVLIALALVAGCGGDEETTQVRVYWLRDGQVWPTGRAVEGPLVESAALTELFLGPSPEEEEKLDATTAIPGGDPTLTIEGGVARIQPEGEYSTEALAQIVYTLTQFPDIEGVEIGGESYTRADFEDETPSVLVESPLPFEEVTSPLRVTGTANTFEANFNYELVDSEGNVVDENFVTATSGTGTRGTFDFTTGDFDDVAALVVFELSAEDGSRIHEVEIPLRTSQ